MIDVLCYFPVSDLFDGHINPDNKMLQAAEIVLNRVRREVSSFQKSPVADDRVDNGHLNPPFQ